MSFHRDVLDGVNAFVAVRNSMKGSAQDEYWDYKMQTDPAYQIWKAQQRNKANLPGGSGPAQQPTAAAVPVTSTGINVPTTQGAPAGGPAVPAPPTSSTTTPIPGAIRVQPPMFSPNSGSIQGQGADYLQRGGMIRHFEKAGAVGPADVPSGALTLEQLAEIRRMAAVEDARLQADRGQAGPPMAVVTGDPNSLFSRSTKAGGYDPRPQGDATPTPPSEPGIEQWGPGAAAPYRKPPGAPATPMTPEQLAAIARSRVSQQGVTPDQARDPRLAGASPPVVPLTTPEPPPSSAGGAPVQPPPATLPPAGPSVAPADAAASRASYGTGAPTAPQGGMTPSEQALVAGQRGSRPPPGVGTGGSPGTEPPPGSMPVPGGNGANRPAGPPGAPGPRGALDSPTRVAAYDPVLDKDDPNNIRPVMPGGAVDPKQYALIQAAQKSFNNALAGGLNFAQFLTRQGEGHPHSEPSRLALQSGVGAMPVQVAQGVVAAWDKGGKIPPYEAMTRYMMSVYEDLQSKGHTAAANQMAFEVIQRLNLEAAKYGQQALAAARSGDFPAAAKLVRDGHAWSADGRQLALSKDGKSAVMVDQFTGKAVTQPFALTPQSILAGAMNLSDGTGLWNHLMQRAAIHAQGQKATDKDAEGRAIRNRNNQLRGKILEKKLNEPAKAKGGVAAAGPATSAFDERAHGKQPKVGGTTIIQGSDDGFGGAGGNDDTGDRSDDE